MRRITLALAFLFCCHYVQAQSTTKTIDVEVQQTFAEYLGSTPAVRDLIPLPPTDPEKRKKSKLPKKVPKNFEGRGKHTVVNPELQHLGPDPIRQSSFSSDSSFVVEPNLNIVGLFDGGSPHDPTGDVGKDYYVQAINATLIGIYDKEGTLLNTFAANTLWSEFGLTSAGDPIILFDQEYNRWIITEFPDPNFLLVAMSKTSDPLGEYDAWSFSTPNFPDYPKYGIWNNAYTITANESQGFGTGPINLETYYLNREAMLNGEETIPIQRISLPGNPNTEAGFFTATPVDWAGLIPPDSDPMILALNDSSWGNTPQDAIEVYSKNIDWDTPNNTTVSNTTVVTSPYDAYACAAEGDGFACIPQKDGTGLDGIPELIMNQPNYRNFGSHETVVLNFMTDVDGDELSGIRWIEMRKTPGSDWSIYQEGTFAPNDGLHRFMGGIAIDASGNIGLGYNVSAPTSFVGIRFTGRRANDPLGEMTLIEYNVIDGSNVINSGGRFGDYSHMTIDPTNDHTFWFTTEYAEGGTGESRTRIVSFDIGRYETDIAPIKITAPETSINLGDNEPVIVEVRNRGSLSVDNFDITYVFDGGSPVMENVNFTLAPDSVYTHTFGPSVDITAFQDYPITVYTSLAGDQALNNDTIQRVISRLVRADAGISAILGGNDLLCNTNETELRFALTNFADLPLSSAQVTIQVNGSDYQTIDWLGSLAPGASEEIPVTITGLQEGINSISAHTSAPNGDSDQRPANDEQSRDIDVQLGRAIVFLRLRTDFSPEEITWEVLDADDQVVVSGGPYPGRALEFIDEEFCLDSTKCYTFVITDAGGDGICCSNGAGRYTIKDAEGNELVNSDGEFGAQEENEFCATDGCFLGIEVDISNESTGGANDGTIIVNAANGVGPFEYSIDGGVTFQASNIFNNLASGTYDVVVSDQKNCTSTSMVEVGIGVSTYDLGTDVSLRVFPNPTTGVFRLEAKGIEQESVFLPLAIFDRNGKLVYESRITRYDDTFTGLLSLYAYPSGVYFLKLYDKDRKGMGKLIRMVKI